MRRSGGRAKPPWVKHSAVFRSLLREFTFWYNEVRPHQHLHGFTPAEVWRGIDPYAFAPQVVLAFEGWAGMLKGYWLRR